MTLISARTLAHQGLMLYYAQLTLNVAWTPLFFGAKWMGLALVDIITLTGTTFYMTVCPSILICTLILTHMYPPIARPERGDQRQNSSIPPPILCMAHICHLPQRGLLVSQQLQR
jgi:hypothetical protein